VLWESRRQVGVIDIDPEPVVAQHSHDEVFKCTLYGSVWLEVVGSDPHPVWLEVVGFDPHPHLYLTSDSHL
jgi:hypothetical protein